MPRLLRRLRALELRRQELKEKYGSHQKKKSKTFYRLLATFKATP